MTPPERRLWNALKTRPDGFKFRRQHDFEPYVLDFFCHEAALAIEVDGLAHELGSNPQRDNRRDGWLADQGIRTLRFRALDIRDNLDGIIMMIVEECSISSPRFRGEVAREARRRGFLTERNSAPSTTFAGPPPLPLPGRRGSGHSLAVDQVNVEIELRG
jgi:very-short-patch-repair endonuclease